MINNKIYIGQTTRSLEERIVAYKKEIANKKRSRPITSAMKKYGLNNFRFEIIEDNIKNKEILDEKERYYIKFYKSLCSQQGYNVELGGNSVGKHSEETKRKISEAQKGEKNHMFKKKGYLNPTSKKVIELTTGKIFGSVSLAAEYFNLNFSHAAAVARGKRGSTGGYVFRYVKNGQIIQPEERACIKSLKTRNSVLPQYQQYI